MGMFRTARAYYEFYKDSNDGMLVLELFGDLYHDAQYYICTNGVKTLRGEASIHRRAEKKWIRIMKIFEKERRLPPGTYDAYWKLLLKIDSRFEKLMH